MPVRPLLLSRDAVETFPCAFELRIGVERGAEIVKRFGFLADGLIGLGAPRQDERIAPPLSERLTEVVDRLLVLAEGEVKTAAIEI